VGAELVERYMADNIDLSSKTKRFKHNNQFINYITPNSLHSEIGDGKRKHLPPLSHSFINGIAYKLTYNGAISHEERDAFIEKLLEKEYGIDPKSRKSREHLDKSIYATLPRFNKLVDDFEENPLKEILQETALDKNYAIVKVRENRTLLFLEVNPTTLKPRSSGSNDEILFGENTLIDIYNQMGLEYSKKEVIPSLPLVRLVNYPFKPRYFYDEDNSIDCLNLAEKSLYQDQAISNSNKPENIITKAIHSVFGDNAYNNQDDGNYHYNEPINREDFYYHLLAHMVFGSRAVQTVLMAVSSHEDSGGRFKTGIAAHLPSRLIATSAAVKLRDVEKGWGNLKRGRSYLLMNDLQKDLRAWETTVYPEIRDSTTGGIRRMTDLKYGGFITYDSSCGYTVSANFMPPLEDHDRRAWVITPASLKDTKLLLSKDEALKLKWILEDTPLDYYHEEIQELANYLLYLYKNEYDKYSIELYVKAPETPERRECISLASKGHLSMLMQIIVFLN